GVGGGLGEPAGLAQRAVDLVGGHVQETEGLARRPLQRPPVVARGLEQRQGADHVGLHERARPVDGPVDVALGGEVQDRVRAMLAQQGVHQRAIADVAMDEDMVVVPLQRRQGVEVAGVGERVEVDHALPGGQRLEHEVPAEETGSAGDKPGLHGARRAQSGMSSSAKSSPKSAFDAGGASRSYAGALRCCGRSWRSPRWTPPSPPPPSIYISSAMMSVKYFSTPSCPVNLS